MKKNVSGIVANLQGEVTEYGKGAEKIFGYMREEILGKSVSIFHPPNSESLLEKLFKTAMETGVFEEKVTLVRKGGERFPALLRVTAIKDEEGNVTALAGMTEDLSQG